LRERDESQVSALGMCEECAQSPSNLVRVRVEVFVEVFLVVSVSPIGCPASPFIATKGGMVFTCASLVVYPQCVGGLQCRHYRDRPPRPCDMGSGMIVPVGGVAEPCLGRGRRIRGPVVRPAAVEQ